MPRRPVNSRRRANKAPTYDEISHALDVVAAAVKTTGDRKLLLIYERLENELNALDTGDAVMARAMNRTRRKERERERASP